MKKDKTNPERTRCATCGGLRSHAYNCTTGSVEEQLTRWKAYGEHYAAQYMRLQTRRQRQQEIMELWQGKYAIVKHENNQLRRRMRRMREGFALNDMQMSTAQRQACYVRYIDLMHMARRGIELDAETQKEWDILQAWHLSRAAYAGATYDLLEWLDAHPKNKTKG